MMHNVKLLIKLVQHIQEMLNLSPQTKNEFMVTNHIFLYLQRYVNKSVAKSS